MVLAWLELYGTEALRHSCWLHSIQPTGELAKHEGTSGHGWHDHCPERLSSTKLVLWLRTDIAAQRLACCAFIHIPSLQASLSASRCTLPGGLPPPPPLCSVL